MRASGTPAAPGEALQGRRLAGPVQHLARQLAGDHPVLHDELVRRQVVDTEVGDDRTHHLGEAPADHGELVAEPLERAHQRAGTRREEDGRTDRVEVGLRQPGQQPHSLPQRLGEVELAGHGGRCHGGHLGTAAPPLGQQVDDLPLEQGRVGVHHDQVLGPAVQTRRLDRDVHLSAAPPRRRGRVAAPPGRHPTR